MQPYMKLPKTFNLPDPQLLNSSVTVLFSKIFNTSIHILKHFRNSIWKINK